MYCLGQNKLLSAATLSLGYVQTANGLMDLLLFRSYIRLSCTLIK